MLKRVAFISIVLLLFITGCGNNSEESKDASEEKQTTTSDSGDVTEVLTTSTEDSNQEEETNSGDESTATTEVEEPTLTEDENASTEENNSSSETTPPPSGKSNTPPRYNDGKTPVTTTFSQEGKFVPSIDHSIDGNSVVLNFKVKNQTENMFTFHFGNSKRYEYVLMDEQKNVIEQYSKKAKFTNLAGIEPVKPGGSLKYEVTFEDLPKGKYSIMFVLTAEEMQPKISHTFEIK